MLDFDPFDDFRKSFSDRRSAGDFFRPSRNFSPSHSSFEDNLNVWGFASPPGFSGASSSNFDENTEPTSTTHDSFDDMDIPQSERNTNFNSELMPNESFSSEDYKENYSPDYNPDFISTDSTPLSHISPSDNDNPSTDFWEKLVAGARDNTEETRRREKARRQALLKRQQEFARQEEAQRQQRMRHQEKLLRQEEKKERRQEIEAQASFDDEEDSANYTLRRPYYDDSDDQRTTAFRTGELDPFENTSTHPSPTFNTSRYEFTEEGRDGAQPWHPTSEGRRLLRGTLSGSSPLYDQSTADGSGIHEERFSTQESTRPYYHETQSSQSRFNTQSNSTRNAGRIRENTFSSQSRAQYRRSVNDSTNPGPNHFKNAERSIRSSYPLEDVSSLDASRPNKENYPEVLVPSDETHIRSSNRTDDIENTLLGAYKPLRRRDANLHHVLGQNGFGSSTQQSAYNRDRTGSTFPNYIPELSSNSTQRARGIADETVFPREFSPNRMPLSAQLSEDYINSDRPSMDRSTRRANYPRLPEKTHSSNNTRQSFQLDGNSYSTQSSRSPSANLPTRTSEKENDTRSRTSEARLNTRQGTHTQVLPKMKNTTYQNNSSDMRSSYAASPQSPSAQAYYSQQSNYMPAETPDIVPVASTPSIRNFAQHFDSIFKRLRQVIIGKDWQLRLLLVSLFAQGHILIEDAPGTGKTRLAQTLARGIDIRFNRIQFTGDLNPSDIIGVTLYNSDTQEFRFKKGPIFSNILLADELNRATPKIQAILLEAMSDHTVATWHETYDLPSPFMVIATEDPQDYIGTYPLPQGEIDRFLIKMALGYPDLDSSLKILRESISGESSEILQSPPVLTAHEVTAMQQIASRVHADDAILRYVMAIIEETRQSEDTIKTGASIRGALGLVRAAKVWAAAQGRSFVSPKDIRAMSIPVLSHRIELTAQALYSGHTAEAVMQNLLTKVPAPISYTPNPYVAMSHPASPHPIPNAFSPRSIPSRSLPLRSDFQPQNMQSVGPQEEIQENINMPQGNNYQQNNQQSDLQENVPDSPSLHMPAIPAYRPRSIFPRS